MCVYIYIRGREPAAVEAGLLGRTLRSRKLGEKRLGASFRFFFPRRTVYVPGIRPESLITSWDFSFGPEGGRAFVARDFRQLGMKKSYIYAGWLRFSGRFRNWGCFVGVSWFSDGFYFWGIGLFKTFFGFPLNWVDARVANWTAEKMNVRSWGDARENDDRFWWFCCANNLIEYCKKYLYIHNRCLKYNESILIPLLV